MNKVVARFVDGRILKGTTADFAPTRESFHLLVQGVPAGSEAAVVRIAELKALFFVKDYAGSAERTDKVGFEPAHSGGGRRIKVTFKDGEVLLGTTTGYQPGRPGFFLVPADDASNNERCYVVASAASEVKFV